MTENEVWKDVVGYEGLYKVSDRGNVYSVERVSSQGKKIGGRILRPRDHKDGYLRVNLYKNGRVKTKSIHRLVTEAFIPNPKKLPQVNHKDENPSNNELSNLEWCDARYNLNYGTRTEKVVKVQSKKVRAVNIKTGEIIIFKSTSEAGSKGYNQSSVAKACKGVYNIGGGNLYRGHKWYYEEDIPK